MNLGLARTLAKLRVVSARLAVVSPARCGSLKKISTAKNIKDADGGNAEDIFHAEMLVHAGGDEGSEKAANVYEGVVDGVADAADVGLGGAGGGADHAGFYQGDAEGGEH